MSEQPNSLTLAEIRADEYKAMQVAAYKRDIERLHARLDEFVPVTCPACNGNEATFRFEKYRCRFVECDSCATLYMSPRPSPAVMEDYYCNSENYAVWNKYIFPKSESSRRDKICRPNLECVVDECRRRQLQRPSLLEVGPGFGTFAALAKESGCFASVTVVERTPEMVTACRAKGLDVIDSSLEEVDDARIGIADVAACFEVLEHVFDPAAFLKGVYRMLRPGGLFVFTCPNGAGFDTTLLQAASPAVDTEHVNLFNPSSIGRLLRRCGFEVVSVETPGRLDVELARRAVLAGEFDVSGQPFWRRLLVEEFDALGNAFQQFLAQHKLSGNMRVVGVKEGRPQ
jgi:2-polyprenyl-3-methyl-5-hydroxy-6-metoxy-1,4-benzoquinol methylase